LIGVHVRRTRIRFHIGSAHSQVAGIQINNAVVVLLVEVVLFDERQEFDSPVAEVIGIARCAVGGAEAVNGPALVARQKRAVHIVVGVHGQANLLEIVRAAHTVGGLAHLLNGGQEQANEHSNNRNHYQQFDQSKAAAAATTPSHWTPPLEKETQKRP